MRSVVVIVLALALASLVSAAISDVAAVRGFKEFRAKYNKQYNSPIEANRRFAIYRSNMDFIEAHNAKFAAGESTYEAGENEFIDLSSAEFVAQMNGYRKSVHAEAASTKKPAALIDVAALPTSVDWRTKGIVTGIKNQGQCGSCWSFSTTGSTEGQHALTTGSLVSLSEQNLVDCSTPEGNEGCGGGEMTLAFEYIIKNNGIDTEASYPYTATGPNKCQFNPANVGATLIHYSSVATGSESALQQASATVGPISVAIDASHQSFQVYKSGVYYEPACSTTQLDHGVLVVGYGTSGSSDYYIVKNSWGTTWGMEGYIWMSRNRNNNCGIASDASWPIAPNATTSTVSAIATTTGPAASGAVTSAAASSGAQSSSGASGSSGASSGASSGSGSGSSGSSGSGNYGGSSGNYGSSSGNSGSSGQSSNSGSGSGSGASGQSSGSNAASSGAGNGSSGDSYSASSSGTSQDSAASNSAGYSSGYSGSLFSTTTGTAAGTTTGSTKH